MHWSICFSFFFNCFTFFIFYYYFDLLNMTVPSRITYEDFTEALARLDFDVQDLDLPPRDQELYIDLGPCISLYLFLFASFSSFSALFPHSIPF